MNSQTRLILFITGLLITAIIAGAMLQLRDVKPIDPSDELRQAPLITSLIVDTIYDNKAYSLEIEVSGSDHAINLTGAVVTIQTDAGQQDLRIIS